MWGGENGPMTEARQFISVYPNASSGLWMRVGLGYNRFSMSRTGRDHGSARRRAPGVHLDPVAVEDCPEAATLDETNCNSIKRGWKLLWYFSSFDKH